MTFEHQIQRTYRVERQKWDAFAHGQAADAARLPPYADFDEYVAHSTMFEGAAGFLGDLRGKRVLDCGSGVGMTAALLARSGALVSGYDISPGCIEVARARAALNNLDVELVVATGEDLPFADATFDVVVGKAILHHLDAGLAAPELRRVLRAGGKALFSEPMGMNPIVNFARDRLPYRDKTPRGADVPLTYEDIERWCEGFRHVRLREIQLLSMAERLFGWNTRFPTLRRADHMLLRRFPSLRRFCRYVVMEMEK